MKHPVIVPDEFFDIPMTKEIFEIKHVGLIISLRQMVLNERATKMNIDLDRIRCFRQDEWI